MLAPAGNKVITKCCQGQAPPTAHISTISHLLQASFFFLHLLTGAHGYALLTLSDQVCIPSHQAYSPTQPLPHLVTTALFPCSSFPVLFSQFQTLCVPPAFPLLLLMVLSCPHHRQHQAASLMQDLFTKSGTFQILTYFSLNNIILLLLPIKPT